MESLIGLLTSFIFDWYNFTAMQLPYLSMVQSVIMHYLVRKIFPKILLVCPVRVQKEVRMPSGQL